MKNNYTVFVITESDDEYSFINSSLKEADIDQFNVIHCASLNECETRIKNREGDSILLDLGLPEMKAWRCKVFNLIHEVNENIPIIIMCRSEDKETGLFAIKEGAKDILIKGSFDGLLLARVIISCVERKRDKKKISVDRFVLDNVTEAIYSTDLDGFIQRWNKSANQIFGYTSEEVHGKTIGMLFSKKSRQDISYIYSNVKAANPLYQFVTTQIDRNGIEITVSMNIFPIRDYFGLIESIIFICLDITEKKLSEQMLAIQYRTAVILNESLDVNAAARGILITVCEILEWKGGEFLLLDASGNELNHVVDLNQFDMTSETDTHNATYPSGYYEMLLGYIQKNQRIYWTPDYTKDNLFTSSSYLQKLNLKSLLCIPVILEAKVLGVLLFYSDDIPRPDYNLMTLFTNLAEQIGIYIKRKKNEIEMINYQVDLQAKNFQLEQQSEYLREADRAKNTFLANMSHELRTPLNSIIGFAELIYQEKAGPVSEEHKTYLKEVAINGHHLLNLISDILDLTKIEAGKLTLHPQKTNLETLATEASNAMALSIQEKKIHFQISVDPLLESDVIIDPDKVRQVLFNYLSNAVKFTSKGGKIEVHITPVNQQFFRIEVSDTGIGIRKKDIDKLFVMFQQLNISYSKQYQGTGLGLALTRHIVEFMGGYVGVESEPGKGSTFYAVLPWVHATIPAEGKING